MAHFSMYFESTRVRGFPQKMKGHYDSVYLDQSLWALPIALEYLLEKALKYQTHSICIYWA